MANFENLIRNALAGKNNPSLEVREKVYQSSRNALQKLVESNRSLTVEAVVKQQKSLEDAISKVEREYAMPEAPTVDDDPLSELKDMLGASAEGGVENANVSPPDATAIPTSSPNEKYLRPVASDPVVEFNGAGNQEDENLPPLEFSRRRKAQKRLTWTIATLVILLLFVWIAFLVYREVSNGTFFGLDDAPPRQLSEVSESEQSGQYITVVSAEDLSALQAAGRGQAEITSQLNQPMIRLFSMRDASNRSDPAKPILLKLQPGVLEQISGRRVTFEIYAKSGTSSPAQFTVACNFGALGDCGRKRFRVGLQPEASIFAVNFDEFGNVDQDAFIEINTDTTSSAAFTGKGDVIDLVYVRIRVN